MNLRGPASTGGGKATKLLWGLMSSVHSPRKTSSFQGAKWSSKQLKNELIAEQRVITLSQRPATWLGRESCAERGRQGKWARHYLSLSMFPTWSCHPAAALAIRHLSVPALEQLTGAMGICQLPFWANSAKQEGTECSSHWPQLNKPPTSSHCSGSFGLAGTRSSCDFWGSGVYPGPMYSSSFGFVQRVWNHREPVTTPIPGVQHPQSLSQ